MDKFSYTIMLKNIQDDPLAITEDLLETSLYTLPEESVAEIFKALTIRLKTSPPTEAKHLAQLLRVIWHYQ